MRLEIEYTLANFTVEKSIQPLKSDEVLQEKDINCIEIPFARTEYPSEISGFQDSTKITML